MVPCCCCFQESIDKASKDKVEMDRKLASAQEYIQRMMNERSDIEKKFHAMKEDLMTRLTNGELNTLDHYMRISFLCRFALLTRFRRALPFLAHISTEP